MAQERCCAGCGRTFVAGKAYRRRWCAGCWLARRDERTAQSWDAWHKRTGYVRTPPTGEPSASHPLARVPGAPAPPARRTPEG
jgi:hypothetical protein